MATHPKSGRFAYAEEHTQPNIYVHSFPQMTLLNTLSGATTLEICAIAFSADGKRMVSCGNLPDFRMCVWDIEPGTIVCETKLDFEASIVEFDPLDSTRLCVFGEEDAKITFWHIDTAFTSASLIET